MSHEFYQIMVGAPTISLYSWKQLARWSIEYSCLNDSQKQHGQKLLDKSWKIFCAAMVKDFECLMKEDFSDVDEEKARAAYGETDKANMNQGMGRPTNNSNA